MKFKPKQHKYIIIILAKNHFGQADEIYQIKVKLFFKLSTKKLFLILIN